MPPALRPLCFACLTFWMAVPVCTASPVVLSATMAPIADDEPTSAPRSPAPENLVPDAPLLDPAKPDTTGFINPKAVLGTITQIQFITLEIINGFGSALL